MKPIISLNPGVEEQVPEAYVHLLRTKTREAVAAEYGVCIRTFRSWMKTKCPNIPKYKLLSPHDIRTIYLTLGWPPLR